MGCVVNTMPSCRFTPRKKTIYSFYKRLGGPTGLIWTGGENLAPHRSSVPGSSGSKGVAIPTELSRSFQTGVPVRNEELNSINHCYMFKFSAGLN
jgi:hypothetical protein